MFRVSVLRRLPHKMLPLSLAARVASGALMTLLLGLLTACGGGGGSGGASPSVPPAAPTSTPTGTGTVALTLTDAPGDFLSYTVDVTKIELRKANGDVVQALPLKTRSDFAQLAKVSEFLNIATVPEGVYDQVTLSLDYANAKIVVQDTNGNTINATVQDAAGQPLTTLVATLKLADSDKVTIRKGIPANFALDFDLSASNSVAFGAAPPSAVVTVSPFLMAAAQFDATREHRVRGLFDSADKTASSITLKIRPFEHQETQFGKLTFSVTDTTSYEVDGQVLTGSAGLDAVAALAVDTRVIAMGMVTSKVLTATNVVAGTAVPGNGKDAATGVVVSRVGNSFEMRGAHVENHDGTGDFAAAIHVNLGANTKVAAADAPGTPLSIGAISIGQLVTVRGAATTANNSRTLDATAGAVRLEISEVAGEVVAASPLTIKLAYVNAFKPRAFNFAGTGSSANNDAKPDVYVISTTGLDTGALVIGDVVRVRGHVNGFGLAPPDFNARTLVDVALEARAAELGASWRKTGATKTPFISASATSIVLDLSSAETELHLGGIPRAIANSDAVKTLVPKEDGSGEFAVHVRGEEGVKLFRTFAETVDAVQAQLTAGKALLRLEAQGQYNRANAQLTVHRMAFDLVVPAVQ